MTTQTLNGTISPVTSRPVPRAANTPDWRRRPETATPSWEDRAACFNRPEEWWDGDDAAKTARARATCRTCPVLDKCLQERMQSEGHELGYRYAVRGGLTGAERVQLYVENPTLQDLDAEESRLIALEAVELGRPAADVALEGTAAVTVRLAARLAGEPVPVMAAEVPGDSALRRALSRAVDIMQLVSEGEASRTIAARLGLRRASVESVMKLYQDADVLPARGGFADAMDEWLAGQDVSLSAEERLVALRRAVLAGRSFSSVDRVRGLKSGTTKSWVARQRRSFREKDLVFPVPTLEEMRQQNLEAAA